MHGSRHVREIVPLALAVVLAVGATTAVGAQPDAGSELRFYNWDEFVDPQIIEDFEAEFGIDVIIETFTDENEAVSVIQADAARYDLFITSDSMIWEMAEQRLLAKLDHGNIPNLINVDPRYLDLPADPGNRFSVPYDWGTTGLAYNTDCVEPEEESWKLLQDPRAKDRIAMDTDFTVAIGTSLKRLGHSLNSRDPALVAAAITWLEDLRADQGLEFIAWDETLDLLVSGELCVGQAYNGDAAYYMEDNDNLAFFVPTEGSDFYVDSMAVPRDAPNQAGAELFINYLLRPDVHAANTEYTGYGNPNRASIEGGFVSEELLADPVRYPNAASLEPWVPFDTELRSVWNEAWARFITHAG